MPRGIVSALLLCVACGGESLPATSVNGTIASESMVARDAVSNIISADEHGSATFILVTDLSNTCTSLTAGQAMTNVRIIVLELATMTGSTFAPPMAPGVHTIRSSTEDLTGNVALVFYWPNNGSCQKRDALFADSGKVTLTRVEVSGYSGTFDIVFSDSSHVTGSFTSSTCTGLDAQFRSCT